MKKTIKIEKVKFKVTYNSQNFYKIIHYNTETKMQTYEPKVLYNTVQYSNRKSTDLESMSSPWLVSSQVYYTYMTIGTDKSPVSKYCKAPVN